ncbi:hypothetical protein [Nocardia coubleae]|uniref:Uncharacterized protein n=1 Tax=Nocardia coubleae TaxID=356147 RepID=A0A846VZ40_9NOCA|nr:hypothetical protein [Nocardia coubleae]NKX86099.1 hypothetical protein [Nocardia coubleae]
MRSLLAVSMLSLALLVAVPPAAADPFDGEPAEIVSLAYDFGRCDTSLIVISSDVPVRLDITVRNQFELDTRVRIPKFLWMRELPVTIAPVTFSVKFMAAAGEYEFDVVTENEGVRCEGEIIVL